MPKKLYPYINKFNGEVRVLTKQDGNKLSEDWLMPKMAKNEKDDSVFRFEISTPVIGKDGKTHMGTATVDLSEAETSEGEDVNTNPN